LIPPLDHGFQRAVICDRRYVAAARDSGKAVPLVIGLERENGLLSRFEPLVLPEATRESIRYVERNVKFLLWSRGGWRLHIGGPPIIGQCIAAIYSDRGERRFDCEMMRLACPQVFQPLTGEARLSMSIYRQDRPGVVQGIRRLIDRGEYPETLWP